MIKIIKRTIGFFIRFIISMVVIALLTVILEEMGIYKVDTEDEKSIIVGLIFVIAGYWSDFNTIFGQPTAVMMLYLSMVPSVLLVVPKPLLKFFL